MLLNNIDISVYKAKLLNKDIQTASVESYDEWLRNSLGPLYYGKKRSYKKITLQILIEDETDDKCLLDLGNISIQFEKCTIQFDDIYVLYDCITDTVSHTRLQKGYYRLDITLKSAYGYKPTEVMEMNHVKTINIPVSGNLETPAKVVITPGIDTVSVKLTGLTKLPITISNLYANAPVTIDGEKCVVTENDLDAIIAPASGANKWNYKKYNNFHFEESNVLGHHTPSYSDIPSDMPCLQRLITDGSDLVVNDGYNYIGHLKTAVNVSSSKTITFDFYHDDGCAVYLNGQNVYSIDHFQSPSDGTKANVSLNLSSGWNIIEFIWTQHFGPDGLWGIKNTIGSQVDQLNCYYAKGSELGIVNKFEDTDMWAFPTLQPGNNTIGIDVSTCLVDIYYKPKYK